LVHSRYGWTRPSRIRFAFHLRKQNSTEGVKQVV
jgi:hypothetical protein